ncbi:hypothetical protein ABZU32_39035 [Sphaerisporangium sp. NPDC005288]|uniref:hypothetical protein n=1 Tax=Sphaerisporangium sp. NPDC005288 TaxID=3155114 RepID=UPI0033A243D6
MRKRSGRQPRFAAVPNETVDDATHLDLTALGLLTVLLRHRDGWDVTLADVGKRYGYGEDALAAAMGLLQVAQYVLKVRVMDARGLWSTEVVVYDTPASDEEAADLLAAIVLEPGVRQAQLIRPTQTAIDRAAKRQAKLGRSRTHRLREFPESVTTCENTEKLQVVTDSGVNRDSVNPRVFKKTISKKTKKTKPPLAVGDVPDVPREAGAADAERSRDPGGELPSRPEGTAVDEEGQEHTAVNDGEGRTDAERERLASMVLAAVGVVASLPTELLGAMSEADRDRVVRAVERELEYRAPAELAARIRRRLSHWRGHQVRRPVAVALTVIKRGYDCPRPDCEEHMLPSGHPCGACGEIGRQITEIRQSASDGPEIGDLPSPSPKTPGEDSRGRIGPLSASSAPPSITERGIVPLPQRTPTEPPAGYRAARVALKGRTAGVTAGSGPDAFTS